MPASLERLTVIGFQLLCLGFDMSCSLSRSVASFQVAEPDQSQRNAKEYLLRKEVFRFL